METRKLSSSQSSIRSTRSRKPVPFGKWRKVRRFLWDPEEETCMGRTPLSWLLVIGFYLLFFLFLTGIFTFSLYILVSTLSQGDEPWLQQDDSLIGSDPGLAFRPAMQHPFVLYDSGSDSQRFKEYVVELDEFFSKGYNPKGTKICEDLYVPTFHTTPCMFDLKTLGPCYGSPYGYNDSQPCVYIKVNKIFGWSPRPYRNETELPSEMPAFLKKYIMRVFIESPSEVNRIWISCEGLQAEDQQIMGNITYHPYPGVPSGYFPFTGQRRYQSPLLAIKFWDLARDSISTVRCKAWARNIDSTAAAELQFQQLVALKYGY